MRKLVSGAIRQRKGELLPLSDSIVGTACRPGQEERRCSEQCSAEIRPEPLCLEEFPQGAREDQRIARRLQEESRYLQNQAGGSSALKCEHPVIKWFGAVTVVGTILGTSSWGLSVS